MTKHFGLAQSWLYHTMYLMYGLIYFVWAINLTPPQFPSLFISLSSLLDAMALSPRATQPELTKLLLLFIINTVLATIGLGLGGLGEGRGAD